MSKEKDTTKPGQTVDIKYNNWNIRYQVRAQVGSEVCKAMAVNPRSKKAPVLKTENTSYAEAVKEIKGLIDNVKGTTEIKTARVTVNFNSHLARDIVGHGNSVYAAIKKHGSSSYLIISEKQHADLAVAPNRFEGKDYGQQVLTITNSRAKELGLTKARYTLGTIADFGEMAGYELVYHSDVEDGDRVDMGMPGVTVC